MAAICGNGQSCVVCADREITVPALSLEFEHNERKIEELTDYCTVMSAGDALLAAEIAEKTRAGIGSKKPTIQQIAEDLRDVYMRVHLERAERVILHPRGLTLKEFREKGAQQLPLQIYLNLDNLLFNFGIGAAEFLVAGVEDSGAHVYRIHYSGVAGGNWLEWCDKLGYRAVGSGSPHATILLGLAGQHRALGIAETLYNIYCSKKNAELAPGVGRATDLAIVSKSGTELIPSTILDKFETQRLEAIQKGKVSPTKLQDIYDEWRKTK